MPRTIDKERGSGNVFADLDLPNAGDHLIKAGLVMRIDRIIRQRELSHEAAAEVLGMSEAKVSAMLVAGFGRIPLSGCEVSWTLWVEGSRRADESLDALK